MRGRRAAQHAGFEHGVHDEEGEHDVEGELEEGDINNEDATTAEPKAKGARRSPRSRPFLHMTAMKIRTNAMSERQSKTMRRGRCALVLPQKASVATKKRSKSKSRQISL